LRIAITGTPGVGKHTIAKMISEYFGIKLFDLTLISKEEGLFEENNGIIEVDTDKLAKKISDIISNDGIIVGHLAPYVLQKSQIDKIIILRRNPNKLVSIFHQRGYSKEKIQENIESEILGVISYDVFQKFNEKATQVEIRDTSIEENFNTIIKAIEQENFFDKVDWLEEVATNNELQKFFSY
jgi:adenylate kinase